MASGALTLLLFCLQVQIFDKLVQAQPRLSLSPASHFSPLLSWPQSKRPSTLPSVINAHREPPFGPFNLYTPIVSSTSFSSSQKGFSFGFVSVFVSSTAGAAAFPTGIFLAICLGSGLADMEGNPFAFPIWIANAQKPLTAYKQGIVGLHVNARHDLLLSDGDDSVIWAVRNAHVDAIELKTNGNLVMYNFKNETVWQSFDYPRDILLQGQALPFGQEIISSNSLYAAKMKRGGLLFYLKSSYAVPLAYFLLALNESVEQYFNNWIVGATSFEINRQLFINFTQALDDGPSSSACYEGQDFGQPPYAMLEGKEFAVYGHNCSGNFSVSWPFSKLLLNSVLDQSYSSDLVRLENDGVMHGYTFLHINGNHYFSSSSSVFRSCLAPNACGSYSICSSIQNPGCRCLSYADNPNLTNNAFTHMDPSHPSMGCRRAVPLQCKEDADHSLVEIQRSIFISFRAVFEATSSNDNAVTLDTCWSQCLSNCSCAGFYYHRPTSYCLPFADGTPLANVSLVGDLQTSDFSTFLKIQMPSTSIVGEQHPVGATTSSRRKGIKAKVIVPALIASMLVAGCIIFLAIHIYRSWLQKKCSKLNATDRELENIIPLLPTRYTYKELFSATNGFSRIVGKGGSASVYEGVLADSRRVAVKRLHNGDMVRLGVKLFLTEVATIGSVCHYNIVQLYGFCSEGSNRLLVYEYVENCSLDRWIFYKQGRDEEGGAVEADNAGYNDNDKREAAHDSQHDGEQHTEIGYGGVKKHALRWETRLNIALGTARALAYLHEESPRSIIHFDIKPENILLDAKYVAKVADFGLAKLMERGKSSVMYTGVRGTIGYMAPEWLSHSLASKKCDVYSYGMLLLELVGGRRATECVLTETEEQWYFPAWAAECCREGRVTEMVDERLRGQYDVEALKKVLHVAFLCLHRNPSQRPTMSMVYKLLDGSVELPIEGLSQAARVQYLPFNQLFLHSFSQFPGTILINSSSPSNQIYSYSSIEGR